MNQRKTGILLSYVLLIVKNGVFLFFVPLIIRALGKEQYGLYSIIGSFVASMLILDMGLTNSVVRFVSKYRAHNDPENEEAFLTTIFNVYVAFTAVALVLGGIIYSILPDIFHNSMSRDEIILIQRMFAILIVNVCMTLLFNPYRGILAAYERFIALKSIEISQQLLRVILIVTFLMINKSVVLIVVADTVCTILAIAIRVFYVTKYVGVRIKPGMLDKGKFKEVSVYASFIAMNLFANEIYWRIDNVILGVMTNTSMVAIYALGAQISQYYVQFSWSISQIVTPKIVMIVEKGANSKELTDELIKTGRIQLMVVSMVFLLFLFWGKAFIRLWVGPGFDQSFMIAIIVMIPTTILLIQNVAIRILEAKRKHYFRSVTMLLMSIVNVFLTILLVTYMGIIGAATATAVGLLLGNILLLNIYYQKVIGLDMVRFFWEVGKGIVPAMGIAVFAGLVIKVVPWFRLSWGSLMFQGSFLGIIYAASLWYLGVNKQEKRMLSELFKIR